MAESAIPSPGRIFISYRREETAYPAGWLYDRLTDHFGGGQVFKDVDSIQLGDDFAEVITRAVGSCDVLLALIGDRWLTITDAQGRRRLDDPADFVRLEIEAALTRNVRVIPILVDEARLPRADELPPSLAKLVRRQALELSPARFDFDISRLVKVLNTTLAEVRTAHEGAVSAKAPTGKAPDPSSPEPPTTRNQREPAELRPTPGIPLAASAPPAGTRPPSDLRRSPDKQRRRPSRRTLVLAGAGVAVGLILLIFVITASSPTTPPPSGAVATTAPPSGAVTTSPPPTNQVIFQDDFSSRTSGWEDDGSEPVGGRFANGAYRISAPPSAGGNAAGGVPKKASRVYPSAPPNLRIGVEGRRLPASDQSMNYGILCRINGKDAYVLTVSDNYASIARFGAKYRILREAETQVAAEATNQLQAVCRSVEGQQAVHLELWVNGKKAVETTDRDSPISTGTVGLVVGTDNTKRASVAEFDDFVVTGV
jgi:hypothetical protein